MDLYNHEIQEKKNYLENQPKTIEYMTTGTYISIIILNVNRVNAPTKRLAEWIQR